MTTRGINNTKPHPDAESSISEAVAALQSLYPKRWLDAYSMEDQAKVDAIARKCDEIRDMVAELCAETDAEAQRQHHTVISHNQERLGANA